MVREKRKDSRNRTGTTAFVLIAVVKVVKLSLINKISYVY